MKHWENSLPQHVVVNKGKTFCVEDYFSSKSRNVMQGPFGKVPCPHAPSKSNTLTGFRSSENMGLCNVLLLKVYGTLIFVGRWTLGQKGIFMLNGNQWSGTHIVLKRQRREFKRWIWIVSVCGKKFGHHWDDAKNRSRWTEVQVKRNHTHTS